MDVERIAKNLEDISIKDSKHIEHHEVEFPTNTKPLAEILKLDELTILLVELVDEYEKLAGQMRLSFVNGHLNLSRANCSGYKYTKESYDTRPYRAVLTIERHADTFSLRNAPVDKESRKESIKKESIEKESIKKDSANEKRGGSEGLKERKGAKGKTEAWASGTLVGIRPQTEEFIEKVPVRDPVLQFGVLVPYQLRQAQSHFRKGLEETVKLENLRARIERVIEEIKSVESGEKVNEKDTI